jgi:glycosyltransferase involved in cell wall biosynthesis
MKVSFVLPTKNESKTIQKLIEQIRQTCRSHSIEIKNIFITDDSHDNTRKIATESGVKVIIGGGKGLGLAMLKGLKTAAKEDVDFIFSLDADGQVDLEEIPVFLKAINDQSADLVLGSRFLKNDLVDYDYKFINRFGTRVLAYIMNSLTGLKLTDSHGGIRVMRPAVIDELNIVGNHTYVQETIIDSYENGFKIIEIPSRWLKRESGKSRVVLSIPKYVFYTLPILLLRSGAHIRYLFPIGIFLILLSFLDILVVAILTNFSFIEMIERQSFHLFLLLFTTGINLFFFGCIFELLINIKRGNRF